MGLHCAGAPEHACHRCKKVCAKTVAATTSGAKVHFTTSALNPSAPQGPATPSCSTAAACLVHLAHIETRAQARQRDQLNVHRKLAMQLCLLHRLWALGITAHRAPQHRPALPNAALWAGSKGRALHRRYQSHAGCRHPWHRQTGDRGPAAHPNHTSAQALPCRKALTLRNLDEVGNVGGQLLNDCRGGERKGRREGSWVSGQTSQLMGVLICLETCSAARLQL